MMARRRCPTNGWRARSGEPSRPTRRGRTDNNASERALRRVALGRKNYLFVGDADSGANIAGLYSLAATCEARSINPLEYLTDVLSRVGDHPASKLDELLPGPWAAAQD
jgi:IS66 C-terminal element/Transposase IS66 family